MRDLIGRTLGHYRITAKIGAQGPKPVLLLLPGSPVYSVEKGRQKCAIPLP